MLKRCFAIFYLIIFMSFSGALFAEKRPVLYGYADSFEIYLENGSFGNNIVFTDAKGFAALKRVKGESCIVTVNYDQVLKDLGAVAVFSEKTAYGESFYAFSAKIPYKAELNGKTVNIHYFVSENYNKLGTPLIFGGY